MRGDPRTASQSRRVPPNRMVNPEGAPRAESPHLPRRRARRGRPGWVRRRPAGAREPSRSRDFLAAMEARDDARVCAMMTPDAAAGHHRATSARTPIPATAARAPPTCSPPPRRRGTLGRGRPRCRSTASVRSRPFAPGRLATSSPAPVESEVRLERRDGRWLIADF